MNPDPEARDKLLNDLSSTLSPASEPVVASLPKPPVIPDHELVRRIGRGSYGEVWLARNALGTWRAVKVVYRAAFDHERPYNREFEGIRRFEPISRTHPSQLNVLHVGRNDAAGLFYYVMELADDASAACEIRTAESPSSDSNHVADLDALRSAIANPSSYSPRSLRSELHYRGRLPFDECLQIGLALATALDHLHRHGLVHRDIKPSNIIFVKGIPKLADIGLVAQAEATLSVVGTEGYLPPEGPGTAQADIFSLGKVLYEMATGRDRQEFPELPTDLIREPAAERAQLAEFNEIIVRACHADLKQRYKTAAELHAELATLQSGKSVARSRAVERRLRFLQRAAAVITVIAAIVAGLYLWQARQTHIVRDLATEKSKLADTNGRLVRESRQQLVQMQTANGVRAMDSGDPATAALWFSEVLKQSQGDPAAEQRERFRLGMLFRYLPKPVALFKFEQPPLKAWFTDDGQRLVAVGGIDGDSSLTGQSKVWETASSRLIHSVTLSNTLGFCFSPSGRWAFVLERGRQRLWDVSAEPPVEGELDFSGTDEVPAFSPDESKVATVAGREIRILEIPSGRLLTPPLVHSNKVIFLEFDREGRQLVSATKRETVKDPRDPNRPPTGQARVWNATTGEPVTDWLECGQAVSRATFSPGGKVLAILGDREQNTLTGARQNGVRVFDLPSGRLRFSTLPQNDSIIDVELSPDGRFLATASANHTAMIWNAQSGEPLHPPLKHAGPVFQVCFSPDGAWLATKSETEVCVWNVRSGVMIAHLLQNLGKDMAFSPEGDRLMTTAGSGQILMWDLAGSEPGLPPFRPADEDIFQSATFAPAGDRIVRTGARGELQVLRTADGRPSVPAMIPKRDKFVSGFEGNRATWSRDGRWLAAPNGDFAVCIWNAFTGEPSPIILRHSNFVWSAEFSPITNHLLTASADHTARVWDAITGHPITPPLQHSNEVRVARFSPDGRWIATGSADRSARIWDAATGQPLTPPLLHRHEVWALAFSPDGSRLATLSSDEAMIWNAKTGQPLVGPMRHLILKLCFSPNGQYLLTASYDRTARVWDPRSGQPVTPPLTHGGYVIACAFSPDSRKIVTGSYDNTARIWDAATGEPLAMPFKHSQWVLDASFSPDGRKVVTTSADGTAQLWETPTLDWTADEIEALAQLLVGGRVGLSGVIEPLDSQQSAAIWERVSRRLQVDPRTSSEKLARWHQRRLALCESVFDWFGAEFHARRLSELQPGDATARADLARIRDYNPPARDLSTPPELIDLSAFYNASLSAPWHPGPSGNHLAELPRGIQTFASTRFDVRGLVQVIGRPFLEGLEFLQSGPTEGFISYPKRVGGIPISRKLVRLQILHAVQGEQAPDGTRVGHYLVHYANGRSEEIPIIYGRDARDWHEAPGIPVGVTDAVIAWKGNNPASKMLGDGGIRLFKSTWTNPAPDNEVATVDFVAEHVSACPFLVALTAE
jgi:WD40 repeat protein